MFPFAGVTGAAVGAPFTGGSTASFLGAAFTGSFGVDVTAGVGSNLGAGSWAFGVEAAAFAFGFADFAEEALEVFDLLDVAVIVNE